MRSYRRRNPTCVKKDQPGPERGRGLQGGGGGGYPVQALKVAVAQQQRTRRPRLLPRGRAETLDVAMPLERCLGGPPAVARRRDGVGVVRLRLLG